MATALAKNENVTGNVSPVDPQLRGRGVLVGNGLPVGTQSRLRRRISDHVEMIVGSLVSLMRIPGRIYSSAELRLGWQKMSWRNCSASMVA